MRVANNFKQLYSSQYFDVKKAYEYNDMTTTVNIRNIQQRMTTCDACLTCTKLSYFEARIVLNFSPFHVKH